MMSISDDCWSTVFSFLPAGSALEVSYVSTNWKQLSDKCLTWKKRCEDLWEDKQNILLERWVDIRKDLTSPAAQSYFPEYSDFISERIGTFRRVYEWCQEDCRFLQHHSPSSHQYIAACRQLDIVKIALDQFLDLKHQQELKKDQDDPRSRQAMPLSQFILCKYILKEQQLYHKRECIADEESDDLIRQEILEALKNPLRVSLGDAQSLEACGALMSWKQSYIASVRDSQRTWITYDELRAQGEWLICFLNVLEVCRFTSGGRQFIDNRAFSERYCDIIIGRNHLIFKDIRHSATLSRSSDWGWVMDDDTTDDSIGVALTSFDRRKGPQAYMGPLAFDQDTRNKRTIFPLISPLLYSDANEIYRIGSIP